MAQATSKAEIVSRYEHRLPGDMVFPQSVEKDTFGRWYNPERYQWLIKNVEAAKEAHDSLDTRELEKSPPGNEQESSNSENTGTPGPSTYPRPTPIRAPLGTGATGRNEDVQLIYAVAAVVLVLVLLSSL